MRHSSLSHQSRATDSSASTSGKRSRAFENGAGGVLFGSSSQDIQHHSRRWTDEERLLDIHILEMMAALETINWLPYQPVLTLLVFGMDNTIDVSVLTRCYSSSSLLCELAKEIFRVCALKNYHLRVMWVPGKENAADPISRGEQPIEILNTQTWNILHGGSPLTQRVGQRGPTSGNPAAEDFEMGLKRLNI